jgi:hypothetical protein
MSESSKGAGTSGPVEVWETDYVPPCPHCRQPLRRIRKNLSWGVTQSEAIYSCDACGELLGIGYGREQ